MWANSASDRSPPANLGFRPLLRVSCLSRPAHWAFHDKGFKFILWSLYYWLICSLLAKLLLFQGGEVARRHAYLGFDNSFDERVFRQVFVVSSSELLWPPLASQASIVFPDFRFQRCFRQFCALLQAT